MNVRLQAAVRMMIHWHLSDHMVLEMKLPPSRHCPQQSSMLIACAAWAVLSSPELIGLPSRQNFQPSWPGLACHDGEHMQSNLAGFCELHPCVTSTSSLRPLNRLREGMPFASLKLREAQDLCCHQAACVPCCTRRAAVHSACGSVLSKAHVSKCLCTCALLCMLQHIFDDEQCLGQPQHFLLHGDA